MQVRILPGVPLNDQDKSTPWSSGRIPGFQSGGAGSNPVGVTTFDDFVPNHVPV
jgi:hypothetical protein